MSKLGNLTAPFIRENTSAHTMMADVVIALLPPLAWGTYVFGDRAIVLSLLSVFGAVLAQLCWCAITKTKMREFSAVITGMIVALLCPVSVPLWLPPLGAAFGVIVGKMIFGGIGRNIFNPAATGLAFLHVLFNEKMNTFTPPFAKIAAFEISPVITEIGQTPLDTLKTGIVDVSNIWEKVYGMIYGNIGELSTIMIVISLIYLYLRGVIKLEKTISYIGSVVFFIALYCYLVAMLGPFEYAFAHLFSGSTMFVAVFLCNDYSTTPTTPNGNIFFGVVCGFFTMILRVFCDIPDGAVFALLLANVFTPMLDRKTKQPYFGQMFKLRVKVKEKADEKK